MLDGLPILRLSNQNGLGKVQRIFREGAALPFGIGSRVCLGQHLALTEMTVIAAMFLQHFRLSVPEGMIVPQPVLNVSLRPVQPLRLQVDVTS